VVVKSPQKEKEKEETHFVRNPEFKVAAEKLQGLRVSGALLHY
jgi:hypothetical protein